MRVLVTGGAGFAGRHVLRDLAEHGHTAFSFDQQVSGERAVEHAFCGDLLDTDHLQSCIRESGADACIHLAGMAFVPQAWESPRQVMRVNAEGTLSVVSAFRVANPAARVLCVTSSEVYGREPRSSVTEDAPLTPSNLYGVSKMAADIGARLYAAQFDLPILVVRPQNHMGPGQSSQFVVSSFAAQVAASKRLASSDPIRVGNLQAKRDFTDVRDVARAYRLLLERGQPGEAYNVASGQLIAIGALLDLLCEIAGIHPAREVDPARFRPTDEPPLLSIEKIRAHTGWQPEIPLERTLRDIYAEAADCGGKKR